MRHRERGTRTRPPGQHQSGPEAMLDALLDGGPLPGEDQAGLQPVADVLAALRAPATPAELTGQAGALAEFRAQPRRSRSRRRPHRGQSPQRGRPVLGTLLRPRPVTALAAAVVVAGLAAGAYEGDLPGPVQQWAHHTFGLTAARTKATPSSSPSRSRAAPSPAPDPFQHRNRAVQHSPAPTGPHDQHADSHQTTGRDGHQHDGQQGSPGPSSGGPGGSPSPSPSGTPQPSTSPAAQPSAQSSTSPGSPYPHSSASSPP
jgi:hypothetical protein